MAQRLRLYMTPAGGLANRLMGLISCMRLADLYDRELLLQWPVTYAMDCHPRDIFANPPTDWPADEFLEHVPAEHRFGIDAGTIAQGRSPVLDLSVIAGDVQVVTNCFLGHPDDNREDGFFNYSKALVDFQEYFRRLGFSEGVRSTMDKVASREELAGAFGVHIRRGHLDSPSEAGYFNMVTEDDYLAIIDAVAPGERIFLATDSVDVRARMQEALGDRLIRYAPRSLQRDKDVRAIQDAYAEINLLARCRAVTGIGWSTFAYVASVIHGAPYIEIQPAGPQRGLSFLTHTYRDAAGRFQHVKRHLDLSVFTAEERELLRSHSPHSALENA